MKTIDSYITEKLHINKDTKLYHDCDEYCHIIRDYCQGKMRLKTSEFIYYCEDDKGKITYENENNLARIYLFSKNVLFCNDIDNVAKDIEKELNKLKRIKKTEVFATSIYFYFE